MNDKPESQPSPPDGTAGAGAAKAPETLSDRDLFLGLIHSFQAAAMQQMGKTTNPFTQEIERDLPQAQLSIDMLRMLEGRTKGNLTTEESRFLAHVLRELQMNFVMEVHGDKKHAPSEGDAPAG